MSYNILAFGDVHGNLPLLFKLASAWQKRHGSPYAILQVGDLGVWPNQDNLDNATRKKVNEGRERLSFQELLEGKYKPDETCPVYFVGGNHEDYTFLEEKMNGSSEPAVPIDPNKQFYYIKNGRAVELGENGNKIRVAGLGGIHKGARPKQERKDTRITYTQDELTNLLDYKTVDILLTHEPPNSAVFGGSEDFDTIHELVGPTYHIFGHVHRHYPEATSPSAKTKTIGLAKVGFKEYGSLNKGCMAVASKSNGTLTVDIVDEDWIRDVDYRNWRWL